jgi:hypothetical protein
MQVVADVACSSLNADVVKRRGAGWCNILFDPKKWGTAWLTLHYACNAGCCG